MTSISTRTAAGRNVLHGHRAVLRLCRGDPNWTSARAPSMLAPARTLTSSRRSLKPPQLAPPPSKAERMDILEGRHAWPASIPAASDAAHRARRRCWPRLHDPVERVAAAIPRRGRLPADRRGAADRRVARQAHARRARAHDADRPARHVSRAADLNAHKGAARAAGGHHAGTHGRDRPSMRLGRDRHLQATTSPARGATKMSTANASPGTSDGRRPGGARRDANHRAALPRRHREAAERDHPHAVLRSNSQRNSPEVAAQAQEVEPLTGDAEVREQLGVAQGSEQGTLSAIARRVPVELAVAQARMPRRVLRAHEHRVCGDVVAGTSTSTPAAPCARSPRRRPPRRRRAARRAHSADEGGFSSFATRAPHSPRWRGAAAMAMVPRSTAARPPTRGPRRGRPPTTAQLWRMTAAAWSRRSPRSCERVGASSPRSSACSSWRARARIPATSAMARWRSAPLQPGEHQGPRRSGAREPGRRRRSPLASPSSAGRSKMSSTPTVTAAYQLWQRRQPFAGERLHRERQRRSTPRRSSWRVSK